MTILQDAAALPLRPRFPEPRSRWLRAKRADEHKDMIEPYWGEFLTSPVPLEMSLNNCSASCNFCFANLNQPNRTADIPQIHRMLAKYEERTTLPALLMRAGYPILISNKVDPFAASNYQQAVPLMRTMTELDIPIAIQTRGGRGIDDTLSFLPPSCWYVSIAQLDDKLRAKLEPGAPPIEERFELIRKLVAHKHRVVLGLNPLVPDWLPDPEPLLARAKDAGAEGVWVENLHLSHRQIGRMSDKEKKAVTLPLIDAAKKKRPDPFHVLAKERAMRIARDIGLETFTIGQYQPSGFWKPYLETYPTLFPVVQEFVNACHETLDEGDVIPFELFAETFGGELPFEGERLQVRDYIGATFHDLCAEYSIPAWMTYGELLRIIWSEPRLPFCPARLRCFAFAGRWDGDGWIKYLDEEGLPYLVFTKAPEGTDEYYAAVGEPDA